MLFLQHVQPGENMMGTHVRADLLVGDLVQFTASSWRALTAKLRSEQAYWTAVFPDGVRNPYSDTVLEPQYDALLETVQIFPFEINSLDLYGWHDLAVLPDSNTLEGRAVAYYSETALAFAIVVFLWKEAGWLEQGSTECEADAIAREIGEMLVIAVRLGKAF